ncbi:MAG: SbcC/MukB-like Walker B domain-containing protein, partial [Sphingomonadaceae bacterium]
FEAQLANAATALQALQQQEQALRTAIAARDQAQADCDRAATDVAALTSQGAASRTALAQLDAEFKALEEQRIETALQLSGLLADLDPAFSDGDMPSDDWKDAWRAAPAAFRAARQAETQKWLAQRSAVDQRTNLLATLEVELKGMQEALAKAGADASAARAAFAAADQAIRAMQEQREQLWAGKEVADIEQDLQDAIDSAKSRVQQQQQAAQLAAQSRVRLEEALAQAVSRLGALRTELAQAQSALSDWLTAFQQRQPEAGLDHLEQLHQLLAVPPATLDAERAALQALERAVADARSVLQERQRQHDQHQLSAPASSVLPPSGDAAADGLRATGADANEQAAQDGDGKHHLANDLGADGGHASAAPAPDPVALLANALNQLLGERKTAHDHGATLQLALAQDSARRQQAHAMLVEIERQEAIEQRWARLSELIGSADGKKFRNYAQQFTLDVLLGYANAHLNHLARRYQLERIVNPAHPSLGLLVRDLDMGGEMRSVHSLSGGESFLVSLALALGLASLSSNRVRVESLFIDEGFGSLDAETLRVAMDALDGLQAMGRKVGVISHVQEMTERISTKILVQPSAGGKSSVTVE